MGTCIICGAPADGDICDTHEEDVVFEFEGTSVDELTTGRFYKGTVDGMAEFGVFVNIGDHVTGLLHKSKLDKRLESLDWETGDQVYVQVTSVRDNGNVDLGWSIRQDDREFRGVLIDDPNGAGDVVKADAGTEEQESEPTPNGGERGAVQVKTPQPEEGTRSESDESEREPDEPPERVAIETLSERNGERVRIEGEVVGVRQTGGPTIFELRDETAAVNCAAFEEAGVRAYPDVEVGDLVRLDGTVERHQNELQVETDALERLEGDERATVEGRLEDAVAEKARPDDVAPLADLPGVAAVRDEIRDAAEAIRRAVIEARPVIVRHDATAEGHLAGVAIERAVLPLVRDEHEKSDAEYHYFDRRPLRDRFYDMDAATGDVTDMLDNRERHDEKLPLFVLVNAGSTSESRDGLELLDVYGAKRVVVDADYPDEGVIDLVDAFVNPYQGDGDAADEVTTGALGSDVAAHVNPDVREDLRHIPAASYWDDVPSAYADLAADSGYDETATTALREAVALEAYYQSYEDKRELITDLVFGEDGDDGRELAEYVAGQFRTKLETELETATPNVERREEGAVEFVVLDTDAYTHRFDFPSTDLLLDHLHRREAADAEGTLVTLGLDEDEVFVRSTDAVDIRAVADGVEERVPNAGVGPRGARNGRIEFLLGERDAVLDAVVAEIADRS